MSILQLLIILTAKYLFIISLLIAAIFIYLEKDKRKDLFKLSLLVLPLSFITAKILGLIYFDPRPFVVENVKPLIDHAVNNGFPSDHTLLTMAISAIVFVFNKKLGIILTAVAVLVGVSRILVKVHHPIDILASVIIAILMTYISSKFLVKYLKF